MQSMQVRRHLNTSANLKYLLAILITLFGYLQYKLWVAEGRVQDSWALEQRIQTLKAENQQLARRNDALQAEVMNLKSGLDVVEEKARRELGLVGKDEIFFQYIDQKVLIPTQKRWIIILIQLE